MSAAPILIDDVAADAAVADQQLRDGRQPAAGRDVGDAALLEGDRARVPALDHRQGAGLLGVGEHLEDVGDREGAEPALQVDLVVEPFELWRIDAHWRAP
jgi:hypothetical protein